MAQTAVSEHHLHFLHLALSEAQKCVPTPTAFCVGCVLTTHWPYEDSTATVLACGYSRELPGNTHAEANALAKAGNLTLSDFGDLFPSSPPPTINELLARADVYTTMEPCSVRTSGLSPCADALIAANVRKCFIGVGEPDDFIVCEGAEKLKNAGIQVVWVEGLEEECLKVARRGHISSDS